MLRSQHFLSTQPECRGHECHVTQGFLSGSPALAIVILAKWQLSQLREAGLEQDARMVKSLKIQWLSQSMIWPVTIKPLWPLVWEGCAEEGMLTTSLARKHFMVSLIISLSLSLFIYCTCLAEIGHCGKLELCCPCSMQMGKEPCWELGHLGPTLCHLCR